MHEFLIHHQGGRNPAEFQIKNWAQSVFISFVDNPKDDFKKRSTDFFNLESISFLDVSGEKGKPRFGPF